MAKPINLFFQKAEGNVHKLYIYDDVREKGEFDWYTWSYKDSETSAKYFREQLEAIPESDTIELHVNSNGGSVKEGVAIYNQLKQHSSRKVGYVDGVAYSVAFVILQACDERVMGIGTSALIHDMWVVAEGNARELRKVADDLDVLMESNRQIFMERSNLSEQQLIEMMEAETFLTPEQCLKYGLIDRVGSYKAAEDEVRESLESQVQQLKQALAMQKTFREEMQKFAGNPKGAGAAGSRTKLQNQLLTIFKNM